MYTTMMNVPLSLNHLLERAGTIFPRNEIVSRLPDKSLVRHSYAQWYRRTRAFASALQKAGLRKGERVATLCWNHHVHLEAYFGIPAAGGVMHTLNLRLSPEEIGWIATGDADAFEYSAHDENDPVAMCYTSGTTGRPKGVAYSHRSTLLHTLVASLGDFWGLRGTDSVLAVTPMFHANCWGMPYGAVMMGVKLVFPGPHLHPDDLLDLMQLEPPTLSLGVPTIWLSMIQRYERALTEEPGRWKLPAGMRSLVGGAAVPESLIRAFDKHGVWLLQGWGMTETSPVATISYQRAELVSASMDEKYRRASMAGTPAPLVDLRIRGEDGMDAPWDGRSVGEIQVRGPFITGSYHQVPVAPDKFTADGWLRTGDVGTMDELAFVRLTDRTKDLIKSGGEWISSVDMENALMAHPAVAESAVIAIPDEKWGERPLGCIVLKPGARNWPNS